MNYDYTFVIAVSFEYSSLDINGYNGRNIPNTLFHQKKVSPQTAIVFPGLAYNCKMPLLYYTTKALLQLGYNVLTVETNYSEWPAFLDMNWDERLKAICSEAERVYEAVSNTNLQTDVLVGKSIGTLALGHLVESKPTIAKHKLVWLTPLLKQDALRMQIQTHRPNSLFIIGTHDSHYDELTLEQLINTTNGAAVKIQDADHSLEVPTNINRSLEILQQIINKIIEFVK